MLFFFIVWGGWGWCGGLLGRVWFYLCCLVGLSWLLKKIVFNSSCLVLC